MNYKRIIRFFCLLLFFIFLCSYFVETGGYYEYHLSYKRKLTEEQMKQFEEDIRNGKDIDINSYLNSNRRDYSNLLTRKVSDANIRLNEYLKKIIGNTFKILEKLVR